MADYQLALSREIDARLKSKCDELADAFVDDMVISCILCLPLFCTCLVVYVCLCFLACCLVTTHPS